MDIKTTPRRFILFPFVLAPAVLKQLNGPVTTNDYKPEFGLIELNQCTAEHFRDVILEPIAESADVPMITVVVDLDIPTAEYTKPGMDYNRACHDFVWHMLKKNGSVDKLTMDPFEILFGGLLNQAYGANQQG